MFSVKDRNILKYIADYRLNIISPSMIANADFSKFATTLVEVFKYIKYSKDDEKLLAELSQDDRFHRLDRESEELINEIMHVKLDFNEESNEVVNMCLATDMMREKAAKARAIEIAQALLTLGTVTLEQIASATQLPVEEVMALADEQK